MILKSNIPIYEQIKDDIFSKIKIGHYKAGQKIPSERDLAEYYDVSRVTLRQSIEELVKLGFLEKKPGSGTYISDIKIDQPMSVLIGIVDELEQRGYYVTILPLHTKYITNSYKNNTIWETLKIPKEEKIYEIKRLILANNQPLLIDYNYIPQEISIQFQNFDLQKNIIYKGLESLGYEITYAENKISSIFANQSQKHLLSIDKESQMSLLKVERIVYSIKDTPLIFTKALFRGDKYSYSSRMYIP